MCPGPFAHDDAGETLFQVRSLRKQPQRRVCMRLAGCLHPHDRLRRIADRLDILAAIQERDDAARTAFEALVAPWERADQRAPVEHQLDVAAEVLRMEQAFL